MKIKSIGIALLLFLQTTSFFAQENKLSDLLKRIDELEKRIEVLESIILNNDEKSDIDFRTLNSIDTNLKNNNLKSSDIANWRKLKIGMKEKDVIELLGEPEHISKRGKHSTVWEYANWGALNFNQDGLSSWFEPRD